MKVIYGIGKVKKSFQKAVLVIGVFDGVHIGHQKLIRAAVKRAKKLGRPTVVMTFSPHPVEVLHPNQYLPFIVSLPHRLILIEQLNVSACVIVRFTKKFSQLAPEQFIKRCLIDHIRPEEVFVGNDFCFGKKRRGTISYFKEAGRKHGFKVNAIASVKKEGSKVGSSHIRSLIMKGKIDAAADLLERPVSVMGQVIKGDGRGTRLGYPTANIYPEKEVILPAGVYAVRIIIDNKRYLGMANIGQRPTFKDGMNQLNIETHVFDFDRSLYGKNIIVEFIKKIRNEKTFSSPKEMTAQLKRDEVKSKSILRASR